MNATAAALACFFVYWLGYRFYAKRIADKVFHLDARVPTPAHELQDGFDYVPTRRAVLFGHHYASIAGLSPMLGPAIAVIWGWLPAMIWVVLGTLFVGAVHDFSALVVSMRARGVSIGKVAESVIGPRAKSLFHAIIFFLIALAMGVFVQIVAQLFSSAFYPESVFPSFVMMVLAVVIGFLYYRKGFPLGPLTGVSFVLTLGAVFWSLRLPPPDLSVEAWSLVLLAYSFLAAVLPVWFLLQPRDFLNSLLLYLGLAATYVGFFVLGPDFQAPAVAMHPEGAPSLFPFVFIVIACGAISGFHGLVSSGTSAKQIDKETDATFVGYGGMMAESLLGLAAILVCTTGFIDAEAWQEHYQSWNVAQGLGQGMAAFIDGSARFLSQVGIPLEAGRTFIALMAVSFALTSLDSATRLLRFNIQEVAETLRLPALAHRFSSSLLAVAAIGFFAFFRVDGQPAGLALWALFGTTNQVLGGLTLLAVTLYLIQRRSSYLFAFVPMVFMLVTTITAMILNVRGFYGSGSHLLFVVGLILLVLALWLTVEGVVGLARARRRAESRST
jgi:carbon starvation protein